MSLFITTHPLWWLMLALGGILWILLEVWFAVLSARIALVQDGLIGPLEASARNDYLNAALLQAKKRIIPAFALAAGGALLTLWGVVF